MRIAKSLSSASNKSQITIRKQFPIKLACARTMHRTRGLTLDKLAFDPTGIKKHGLVYTTLSRVKSIESLYLLNELTHKKFHVKQKEVDAMNRLTTNALWRL